MLSKKQYGLTLLVAVVVFFMMLALTSWYFSRPNWTGRSRQVDTKMQTEIIEEKELPKEVTILPQTRITLKIEDRTTHKEVKTNIDADSLLGLSKEELAERFDDYTIEVFSEKEVCLTKSIASEEITMPNTVYVLGILGDNICIKEKDSTARPVKIDYGVKHLSSYIYSMILNEEIEITKEQKEALLLNPNSLQKILQDYVGE